MPRPHRHTRLPNDPLWPADAIDGITPAAQAEHMRELRDLHNRIPEGYFQRDERMLALSLSNTLSRRDMAAAIGHVESRVNQIIREMAEQHEQRQHDVAMERVSRHLPQRNPTRRPAGRSA